MERDPRIWYDRRTDPNSPGWVLVWDEDGQECQEILDANDRGDPEAARHEAATFLHVPVQSVRVMVRV